MRRKNYHHGHLKTALINAGIEILSKEGITGLTIRKVARRAGVSHAAPYAHFADKQALIAAISTEGYRRLYDELSVTLDAYKDKPQDRLVEVGWTYIQFAMKGPEQFKTMFSGVLEQEKDYPEFREMSKKSFQLLIDLVSDCQRAGLLEPGPVDLIAISLWSLVHGFVLLFLENQISHSQLERLSIRQMLVFLLQGMTKSKIDLAEAQTASAC